MTTQTLKNVVTTALNAVDVAPPEKLHPARATLSAALRAYQTNAEQLAVYQTELAGATAAEDAALNDHIYIFSG